jgi:ribosomal-protein-alanine N-acetyltransferase
LNLNEFKIRKATEDDINYIMELENQGFADGIKENEKVFLERINTFNDGFLLLVDKSNIPVGYIASELWNYKNNIDDSYFKLGHSIKEKHKDDGNELYISSMVLSNKLKGKGYGHILFDYLIDNMKKSYSNLKSSILIVCDDWKKAQKIYTNKGFKKISTIEDFFEPLNASKSDGIIMRKSLR